MDVKGHRDFRTRPEEARNLASRRKGEHAWVLAHPGPASYGKDPGPPVGGRAHPRSGHRRTAGRPRDGHRHPRLPGQLHRPGARDQERGRVRKTPRRRRAGLPRDVACLVGAVPERRCSGHRHRRHVVTSGDHRASMASPPWSRPGTERPRCTTARSSPSTARQAPSGPFREPRRSCRGGRAPLVGVGRTAHRYHRERLGGPARLTYSTSSPSGGVGRARDECGLGHSSSRGTRSAAPIPARPSRSIRAASARAHATSPAASMPYGGSAAYPSTRSAARLSSLTAPT